MSRALSFDTETRGLRWDDPAESAFLVTWADAKGAYYADMDQDFAGVCCFIDAVKKLQRGDRLWGHNLKFDLHHIRAKTDFDILDWCESVGIELWDTDSLDRVLNPTGAGNKTGHGLKPLMVKHFAHDADAEQKRLQEIAAELGISLKSTPGAYKLIYDAYPDEMIAYALQDAQGTLRLGEEILLPQLAEADDGLIRIAQLERDVMPVIYLAERRGVATDPEQVSKFRREFEAQKWGLERKLSNELGGLPASDSDYEESMLEGKGSQALLREALVKAGVPLTERTEDGRLSTAKWALQPFAAEYPVIADLFEWRRVTRFLNTYIAPMVGRDVVHADFQQQEAWTGRMACRRPNMQNWPQRAGKEVRNVLRARPGHKLIVADYAQMEAMIIVRYLNDPRLIESIENGLDMNAWMAAQIWGGAVEDWAKDGPRAEGEQSRKTARHTLYATLYGAGARKVSQQLPFLSPEPFLEISDREGFLIEPKTGIYHEQRAWKNTRWPQPGYQYDEARSLIRSIKSSLPGYKEFLNRLGRKIDDVGYVTTYMGRRNPVGKDKKYVAVAAIVQGTGADVLKAAAVRARRALQPFDAEMVMFTHDELVAEVPDEYAEPALAALVDAMEGAAPDHVPHFRASGAILTHYGED